MYCRRRLFYRLLVVQSVGQFLCHLALLLFLVCLDSILRHNGGHLNVLHRLCLQRYTDVGVILALIVGKSLEDAFTQLLHTISGCQKFLLIGGRDESQFDETAGHRGLAEHQEASLLDTLVDTTGSPTGALLHELGQLHAVGHIMVLHEFEHDIAFSRVGVEALIALLVVFLYQDDRVLALGDIQVVGSAVHTQRIGFQASSNASARQRIGMDGNEQVGFVAIGDVSPFMQRHEDIGLARVDDPHVRTLTFHLSSKGQRHLQIDGFLLRDGSHRSGIVSSMTGINDQRKLLIGCHSSDSHQQHHTQKNYKPISHHSLLIFIFADAVPHQRPHSRLP